MSETDPTSDVAALTVQLLSAYLSNNTVASDDLADLIRSTRAALTEEATAAGTEAEPETFTPAVSVRKSLASSEHILSLIDGKPYKTLKRHLASHGLTPDTYRSRYNLPASYPMVAPDYAAHRRAVAQKIGLGSRKPTAESEDELNLGGTMPDTPAASAPDAAETAAGESKAPRRKSSSKPASRAKSSGAEAAATATEAGESTDAQTAPASKRKSKPRAAARASDAAETSEAPGAGASDATPSTEPDGAPSGEDVKPPVDAAAPKRRARKGPAEPSGEQDTATPADSGGEEPATKPASRKSAAKSKKPQRMARAPKAESAAEGEAG
jgi:predicted transcriptional regulator